MGLNPRASTDGWYSFSLDCYCEYDRWSVESQICKLRDKSDTLIGRACAINT